jgi:hypothetical protein
VARPGQDVRSLEVDRAWCYPEGDGQRPVQPSPMARESGAFCSPEAAAAFATVMDSRNFLMLKGAQHLPDNAIIWVPVRHRG